MAALHQVFMGQVMVNYARIDISDPAKIPDHFKLREDAKAIQGTEKLATFYAKSYLLSEWLLATGHFDPTPKTESEKAALTQSAVQIARIYDIDLKPEKPVTEELYRYIFAKAWKRESVNIIETSKPFFTWTDRASLKISHEILRVEKIAKRCLKNEYVKEFLPIVLMFIASWIFSLGMKRLTQPRLESLIAKGHHFLTHHSSPLVVQLAQRAEAYAKFVLLHPNAFQIGPFIGGRLVNNFYPRWNYSFDKLCTAVTLPLMVTDPFTQACGILRACSVNRRIAEKVEPLKDFLRVDIYRRKNLTKDKACRIWVDLMQKAAAR